MKIALPKESVLKTNDIPQLKLHIFDMIFLLCDCGFVIPI